MKHCAHCGIDTEGGIWCSVCKRSYDRNETRKVLASMKFKNFTGQASCSPKVEQFWQTGDPAVFAKPGAPDYQP